MNETPSNCPCGSGKPLAECCAPYIAGETLAPTAEALMRSRYTAHALVNVPYLMQTLHPKTRKNFSLENVQSFAEEADWQKLEILRTEAGGPNDTQGVVEFKAHYRNKAGVQVHHEVSDFEKVGDAWYFKTGHYPKAQPIRAKQKVGRNDPCPCGSGKKYKKCCGK